MSTVAAPAPAFTLPNPPADLKPEAVSELLKCIYLHIVGWTPNVNLSVGPINRFTDNSLTTRRPFTEDMQQAMQYVRECAAQLAQAWGLETGFHYSASHDLTQQTYSVQTSAYSWHAVRFIALMHQIPPLPETRNPEPEGNQGIADDLRFLRGMRHTPPLPVLREAQRVSDLLKQIADRAAPEAARTLADRQRESR